MALEREVGVAAVVSALAAGCCTPPATMGLGDPSYALRWKVRDAVHLTCGTPGALTAWSALRTVARRFVWVTLVRCGI